MMRMRPILVAAVAATLLLSGGSTAAVASTSDDVVTSTLAALDAHGLLTDSTVDARSAGSPGIGNPSSGSVSPDGLFVESGNGKSVGIHPLARTAGTVAANGRVSIFDAHPSFSYAVTGGGTAANAGYAVIRDASAPSTYKYTVTVNGDPATLVLSERGVLVQDVDGETVNIIGSAWAKDADGVSVPTSYTVEGNVLTQHVNHSGAAYPVVADPSLQCDWVFCTVMYNKSETQIIAAWGGTAATLITAGCTALGGPIAGLVCGFAASYASSMAQQALNEGRCVGIRALIYAPQPTTHMVIEPC